jgi:thiol-disulfide isomerase/thioredoxin
MSFRSTIVPFLMLASLAPLAACDRHNDATPQATPSRLPVEDSGTPVTNATSDAAQANTAEGAPVALPASKIDRNHKGQPALALPFTDPAGKPVTLAAFKGKPFLLNMWATWCGPCVAEMPTLDKAATGITVVAVSQDLGPDGAAKVRPFLARAKLAHIQPFTDPQASLSIAYQAELPTSILYDSTGHEVWRTAGGMDWTSDAAMALLAEAK